MEESWHVSKSMKALMLVFAVVLVGVLGYLVWQGNIAEPSAEQQSATKSTTTTPKPVSFIYNQNTGATSTFYKSDLALSKTKVLSPTNDGKSYSSNVSGQLSPDGKVLLFSDECGSIASYNLSSKEETIIRKSVRSDNGTKTNCKQTKNVGLVRTYTGFKFSPDGTKLLTQVYAWEASWVSMLTPAGTSNKDLFTACGNANSYSWSPDSKKIVVGGGFGAFGGDPTCLNTVNSSTGKLIKELIPSRQIQTVGVSSVDWSPNGKKIAFSFDTSDALANDGIKWIHPEIYVTDSNESNFVRLTNTNSHKDTVKWLNDKQVVYAVSKFNSSSNKEQGIYKVAASGASSPTKVFSDSNNLYKLISLSPDKKLLAFYGRKASINNIYAGFGTDSYGIQAKYQLYIFNLENNTLTTVNKTPAQIFFDGWLPAK